MDSRADIGPKADSLRRLADAGLPVPEARFLSVAAYEEHVRRAGIDALVGDGAGTALDSSAARDAIMRAPVEARVADTLRDWYRELGDGHLAVRSSANAEDLPNASFAGQHGTYFVAGSDELVDRVRDCWASLFSERAVRYRERNGMGHTGIAMAVIVQRLVSADAAGVAFTVNPLDASDEVWIEACVGIGEALVSGKVTPDRFVLRRDGLSVTEVAAGDKHVRIVETETGTEEVPLAGGPATELSIDEETAREVADLALRAEAVFGVPVDVEWALEGETVWLLQARPITMIGRPAVASAPPSSAAPGEPLPIWSNVNTGEILPDVATPMTWTIIHDHANDIFGGMFGALGVRIDAPKLIGLVGGRIYFNLSLVRESFRHLPGFDVDTALGGMHNYVDVPPLVPGTGGAATWPSILRAALAMPAYVIRHSPKKAGPFADDMRRKTEVQLGAIRARPDVDGALRLVRSLNDDFSEFNRALAFMAVAMFGFGILTGLCRRWLGDESGALANRLVAARGEVASADAGHAMWRLGALAREHAAVRGPVLCGVGWDDVRSQLVAASDAGDAHARAYVEAWDDFMSRYGHHRRGELEFANPTWSETPDYVLSIVRGYAAHAENDPLGAYASRSAEADSAAKECLARLGNPLKRAAFRRVLAWGRASARTRENIKSEAVRWLVAIRQALLLLGDRMTESGTLERPDDIFFLEYEELGPLVDRPGSKAWRSLVASRRREHERLEGLSPPPVVVGDWDEASGPWQVEATTRTLAGISVSAGVARGHARVFLTSDSDEEVLPGEILVAPFTDPGWTPYFVPAAGIVMDMGGLLSHGSIIAREYGIPAVVNVGPATRIISTGQLIEVDGEKGEVRILD